VVMDPAAQLKGGYPGMVWVQGLEAGEAEGQVSRWCVDLAQPKRQGSGHAGVWRSAVAWLSLRGGEPGRTEQKLCRPKGRRFNRPTVLLLDFHDLSV
jgi:hypothetical protein